MIVPKCIISKMVHSRGLGIHTDYQLAAGLSRFAKASEICPHLLGCLAERPLQRCENSSRRVVGCIIKHEMRLNLEGIYWEESLLANICDLMDWLDVLSTLRWKF